MQGKWRAVTVCLGWSVRRGGLHGVSSQPSICWVEMMFLNGPAPQAAGRREDGRQHTPSPFCTGL